MSRNQPAKTRVTVPAHEDAIMVVPRDDVLLLISVTRIAWASEDGEERERQASRVLYSAVEDAEALTDENDVIPLDSSWWPTPIPHRR